MNSDSLYVDVLLPLSLPALYTYKVPEKLAPYIKVGVRVTVQFGSKRIYSALVRKIHANKPVGYSSKEILDILDRTSTVSDLQFRSWEWIADYYLCAVGDVMNAALPSGLKLESHSRIFPNPEFQDHQALSDDEIRIINSIDEKGTRLKDVLKIKGIKSCLGMVNLLLLKKAVIAEEKKNKHPDR